MSKVTRPLNPFEQWMARSNLQYIPAEGLELVCHRLRAQGYDHIADEVERLAAQTAAPSPSVKS